MNAIPQRREPPRIRRTRRTTDTYWTLALQKLTEEPNEWFFIRSYGSTGAANTAAYDIRTRRAVGLPPGKWEATARAGDLYVMFVGEDA